MAVDRQKRAKNAVVNDDANNNNHDVRIAPHDVIGPQEPVISNRRKREGILHLIECMCILPQFLRSTRPIFHKFIVFSIVEDDVVKEKFVQCNNCGVAHRVYDIGRSEVLSGRDELRGMITKDDIKFSLPPNLVEVLEANQCELYVWEQVKFVIEEKLWGERVILSSEEIDGKKIGKAVILLDESKFAVTQFNEIVEFT